MIDFIKKNKFKIVITIILSIIYSIYIIELFSHVPPDTDFANLVLEAQDILAGNILRKGWTLTGISFLTTDLLYFIIGTMFFGISLKAYVMSVSLMFLILVIGAQFILGVEKSRWSFKNLILFLGIAGIPCGFARSALRAHTAVMLWIILLVFSMQKISGVKEKKQMKYKILFIISIIFGGLGDPIIYVMALVPILVLSIYELLKNNIDDEHRNRNKILVKLCIIGFVLANILDKLYFFIGGANKNSFLSSRTFETFETLGSKFILYLNIIFNMFKCDFMGKQIVSINTPFYFLRGIIIILAFYIIIITILRFFFGKKVDNVNFVLSLGFVLMSLLIILTNIALDIAASRYIPYTTILFAILIIRHINYYKIFDMKVLDNKLKIGYIFIIIAMICLISSIEKIDLNQRQTTPQQRLAIFLKENNLKNGYSDFWNANIISLYSNNETTVRAILADNNSIKPQYWRSKDDWYNASANFIVINNDTGENFGITEENISSAIGNPTKKLEFENNVIYVYDYDVSKILINGLLDNKITINELLHNEKCEKDKDNTKLIIDKGGCTFGPYTTIDKGKYEITIHGEKINNVDYDVYSNMLKEKLPIKEIEKNENLIKYEVQIPKKINDIEFRIFNDSDEKVELYYFEVLKI